MDARMTIVAQEVGPIIRVRELEKERARIEGFPVPQKTVTFKDWQKEKERILKEEMAQIPKNIVSVASNNISSTYSEEGLVEEAYEVFRKEVTKMITPVIMLQYLPILGDILEDAVYGRTLSIYNDRFRDIDREIQIWTQKIPKPFSPEMINTETLERVNNTKGLRFPSDRCPMESGRYYDAWVTEILKSSKPIFFEPHDKYVEKEIECYKIYLRESQKEQAREQEERAKIPPLPPPGPTPGPLF